MLKEVVIIKNFISKILIIHIFLLICSGPVYAQNSLVILDTSNVGHMLNSIEYIENLGGKMTHRFPPNAMIGDIPEGKYDSIIGHANIIKIETGVVNIKDIAKYGKNVKVVTNIWNNNYFNAKDSVTSKNDSKLKPLVNDMLVQSKKMKKVKRSQPSIPYGAGFYDTSEYYIGDITVGIILPESNGSIDINTENWTDTEKANVISEIQTGLNWWQKQDPRSRLSFTYDIHLGIPTRYEPIKHYSYPEERLWITDVMKFLGYNNYKYYMDNVFDYNNYLRRHFKTDWAYVIFVVDSSNDDDGMFEDSWSAYTWFGGPHTVMTFDNGDYTIINMDYVAAHETGHIFYATDEYNGRVEHSGYLNAVDNENSGKIMHCPLCWGVSSGTTLQLGWRDSDGDKILDIIDFNPVVILNEYLPDPTKDRMPTYTGNVTTNATYPNNNPRGDKNNITINRVVNVRYHVDSIYSKNARPVDKKFDSYSEYFTFTTKPLSEGNHTIKVNAINTAGNSNFSSDELTIVKNEKDKMI